MKMKTRRIPPGQNLIADIADDHFIFVHIGHNFNDVHLAGAGALVAYAANAEQSCFRRNVQQLRLFKRSVVGADVVAAAGVLQAVVFLI